MVWHKYRFLIFAVFYFTASQAQSAIAAATKDANLVHVNDDNWGQILEGEWMVEL